MKQSVTFPNAGLTMAANLYLPENFDENQTYSGIVVVHPGGGVKEQTAAIYAERLANNDFVIITFDASYQRRSEGEPRNTEDPAVCTEDISRSIDYLVTLDYVDENRIGAAGVCAGGGYTIHAAKTERRIEAVAGIAPENVGAIFRGAFGPEENLLGMLGANRSTTYSGSSWSRSK